MERVQPLDLDGVPLYYGPSGTVAAWSMWGKGHVIVCSTGGPIQNRLVESANNVVFLLCALRVLRPQGGVVIFDEVHQGFGGRMGLGSLFSVPGVLAASVQLAICGVLYVLVQGRRMGPPVELPAGPRRTAGHYLDAAGLLYRERCAPGEVAAAYGAFVSRTLARRLGLESGAGAGELAPLLAARCSMSPAEIEGTLSAAARAQVDGLSAAQAAALVRKLDKLMRSV
jgi:hypothetical protein